MTKSRNRVAIISALYLWAASDAHAFQPARIHVVLGVYPTLVECQRAMDKQLERAPGPYRCVQ
jgi:hypothetical protein